MKHFAPSLEGQLSQFREIIALNSLGRMQSCLIFKQAVRVVTSELERVSEGSVQSRGITYVPACDEHLPCWEQHVAITVLASLILLVLLLEPRDNRCGEIGVGSG
jgi:hypothetical protein